MGNQSNFDPLFPVPLSINIADGRKRKTNKAKLKEIICKYSGTEEDVVLGTEKDGYVLDMIARIWMSEITETFEGLFLYYLIIFFLLVDAKHCFLRSKEEKVEKSSLLIMHETNHFNDRILWVTAVGLMNSLIMF